MAEIEGIGTIAERPDPDRDLPVQVVRDQQGCTTPEEEAPGCPLPARAESGDLGPPARHRACRRPRERPRHRRWRRRDGSEGGSRGDRARRCRRPATNSSVSGSVQKTMQVGARGNATWRTDRHPEDRGHHRQRRRPPKPEAQAEDGVEEHLVVQRPTNRKERLGQAVTPGVGEEQVRRQHLHRRDDGRLEHAGRRQPDDDDQGREEIVDGDHTHEAVAAGTWRGSQAPRNDPTMSAS